MAEVKGARRQKAEATKRRILLAANDEFTANGYHGATIASIAERAGVAPQTIYFVFHTKTQLMSALIDTLVLGDEPTVPQESEWWRMMVDEPDAEEALRHFVRGAAPLFQRASTISEILRGAALTDDELRTTYEHHERLRAEGFGQVIALLAEKGPLKGRLTAETATDALLTVMSDATYFSLTRERGWGHYQVVEWLCDVLPPMLFETPASPSPGVGGATDRRGGA